MSVLTPGLPNSFGPARPLLESLAEIANWLNSQLVRHSDDILAALQAIGESLQRLEQAPPVAGYEELLIRERHPPLAARLMASMLVPLGKDRLEERQAERKLSSAIYRLAKVREATPLVISNRAGSIVAALGNEMAMPEFARACVKAGISETIRSFASLAERAAGRDPAACTQLFEACVALKPHVANPRGRIPSEASATHVKWTPDLGPPVKV